MLNNVIKLIDKRLAELLTGRAFGQSWTVREAKPAAFVNDTPGRQSHRRLEDIIQLRPRIVRSRRRDGNPGVAVKSEHVGQELEEAGKPTEPARIGDIDRVIAHIHIAVPRLRVSRAAHYGIR